VIARLKKERDEARSLLAQADRQFPISTPNDATANAPVHSNGKRGFTSYHLVDFVVFLYCKALNFG
jgi:hypothetical protein